MPQQFTDFENSEEDNWCCLWETPSKKSQRRFTRAWVHPLLGDILISEGLAIPKHPIEPSEFTAITSNLATQPEDQFLLWRQEMEASKKSSPRRWPSCTNRRTDCGRKMSAYKPNWSPAGLRNRRNLPTSFNRSIPRKAKRPLYQTTLTYQRMTSYLLTVPRSHAVHHPRMSRKPNPEKGHLANPAGPPAS